MDTTTQPGRRADRFEDRLLAAILTDYDELTSPPSQAPGAGAVTPARIATRRRTPVLVAGTAVAAAAAVAAGVTLLGGPAGPGTAATHTGSTGTLGHQATPAHVETAAFVLRHVRAAVTARSAAILVSRDHAPDSQTGRPVDSRNWSGRGATSRSEVLDAHGRPVSGVVLTIRPHTTISISINYRQHTWSTITYPFGSATPATGPAPLPQTPAQNAARLRAELKAGTMKLAGRATVDGQRALELTRGSARRGMQRIWVSPTTFLPIRVIDTAPGVAPSSRQAIRDDYQWLTNTPAHRRLLTAAAAIPAGFTQVPAR